MLMSASVSHSKSWFMVSVCSAYFSVDQIFCCCVHMQMFIYTMQYAVALQPGSICQPCEPSGLSLAISGLPSKSYCWNKWNLLALSLSSCSVKVWAECEKPSYEENVRTEKPSYEQNVRNQAMRRIGEAKLWEASEKSSYEKNRRSQAMRSIREVKLWEESEKTSYEKDRRRHGAVLMYVIAYWSVSVVLIVWICLSE